MRLSSHCSQNDGLYTEGGPLVRAGGPVQQETVLVVTRVGSSVSMVVPGVHT